MTHLIQLPDGRTIAVDDHGAADAPVVLFLHPTPGSRRFDPDPGATAAAGVRFVTVDRPGYGGSTPLGLGSVPTVTCAADDVVAAVRAIGVTDAAVVGWSGGGRVAAAVAARHPELVRSLAILGTPAPDDEVPWVPDEHRGLLRAMRAAPSTATAQLAEIFAGLAAAPDDAVGSLSAGPADEVVASDGAVRGRLVEMLREAFRSGAGGVAADIVADQVVPWGFDPASIGAPTTLFYGDADPVTPPEHGRWWASRIPDADLRVVAGAGHLLPVAHWAEVLEVLSSPTAP